MLGIGLGAAADAWQKQTEINDKRARTQLENSRADEEYNRSKQFRDNIDGINTKVKTDFDAGVAAGEQKPGDFQSFWKQHALPEMSQQYLLQGRPDLAQKVTEWGQQDDVKQGAEHFSRFLVDAETGNYKSAVDNLNKAVSFKGYGGDGYSFSGGDIVVGPNGEQRIRVNFMDKTGVQKTTDIKPGDFASIGARIANPVEAFKSRQEHDAEMAKQKQDLDTYEQKKNIDKKYSDSPSKGRAAAIKDLRERFDGGLAGDEVKFDDMPADEKEKLLQAEMEFQNGSGATGIGEAPAEEQKSERKPVPKAQAKVVVDKTTGEVLDPDKVVQADKAAKEETQKAAEKPTRQQQVQATIADAADRLANGDNPEAIAQQLGAIGIPQKLWPGGLAEALSKKQKPIGLGEPPK